MVMYRIILHLLIVLVIVCFSSKSLKAKDRISALAFPQKALPDCIRSFIDVVCQHMCGSTPSRELLEDQIFTSFSISSRQELCQTLTNLLMMATIYKFDYHVEESLRLALLLVMGSEFFGTEAVVSYAGSVSDCLNQSIDQYLQTESAYSSGKIQTREDARYYLEHQALRIETFNNNIFYLPPEHGKLSPFLAGVEWGNDIVAHYDLPQSKRFRFLVAYVAKYDEKLGQNLTIIDLCAKILKAQGGEEGLREFCFTEEELIFCLNRARSSGHYHIKMAILYVLFFSGWYHRFLANHYTQQNSVLSLNSLKLLAELDAVCKQGRHDTYLSLELLFPFYELAFELADRALLAEYLDQPWVKNNPAVKKCIFAGVVLCCKHIVQDASDVDLMGLLAEENLASHYYLAFMLCYYSVAERVALASSHDCYVILAQLLRNKGSLLDLTELDSDISDILEPLCDLLIPLTQGALKEICLYDSGLTAHATAKLEELAQRIAITIVHAPEKQKNSFFGCVTS